jgi:DnaJ-class molecular chaperone
LLITCIDTCTGKEPGDVVVVLTPLREENEEFDADEDTTKPESKVSSFAANLRNNMAGTSPSKKQRADDRSKRPKFMRLKNGVDLVMEKKIALIEALLGFEFSIRHLDDRILVIKSPPKFVAENDSILLVEGAGMPKPHGGGHGDLFIKLQVVMPTPEYIESLGPGKQKMLRELLPAPLNHVPSDALETQPKEIVDPVTKDKTIIPAPEVVVAKVYDKDLQNKKQRQQAEERDNMDMDEDEGAGGQQAQCKPM